MNAQSNPKISHCHAKDTTKQNDRPSDACEDKWKDPSSLSILKRLGHPLCPIQLATKVPRSLHQLLILLLLHLELSLSLNTDGVHVLSAARILKSQLSLSHAFQEASRSVILDNAWAVGHDADLSIDVGGLLDGEHGLVDSVVRRVLSGISLNGRTVHVRNSLGLGQRGRAEGEEVAGHGVDLEIQAGLCAINVLELELVHAVAQSIILVSAECHLSHGSLQLVDGARQGRCGLGDLARF